MITYIDVIYAFVWFICGLFVFQTGGYTKKITVMLDGISSIITVCSIISLIEEWQALHTSIFNSLNLIFKIILISKITGAFTLVFYLLGANISRGVVMHRWSDNLVLYILIVFIFLWLYSGHHFDP